MIKVTNLRKHYENHEAVKDIAFEVKKGAFFALLGPNGAGKSTTIEMISTLKSLTSGTIEIDGLTVGKDDALIRKKIGVVFQYSTLDEELTALENLRFRSALYGMNKETFTNRLEALNEVMAIDALYFKRVKTLSGGERRKIDIARALLHEPSILILDEPTTGLDPKSRQTIWELITRLKDKTNMTLFLTTHYMEEVIGCDHVVILHKGTIRAEDSAENLRKRYASDTLKLFYKDTLLKKLDKENIAYKKNHSTVSIDLEDAFDGIELITRFKDDIDSFEILKARMDDVFLNITGDTLMEDGQ